MSARFMVLPALLAGFISTSSARSEVAPDSVRVPRLAAVGRLWSAIELFHPSVPERPAAWDSALVRAIPAIRAARSRSEYVAAVDSMLAMLRDRATRVRPADDAWEPSASDPDRAGDGRAVTCSSSA